MYLVIRTLNFLFPGLHQNLRTQADQKVEARSGTDAVVAHRLLHQGKNTSFFEIFDREKWNF